MLGFPFPCPSDFLTPLLISQSQSHFPISGVRTFLGGFALPRALATCLQDGFAPATWPTCACMWQLAVASCSGLSISRCAYACFARNIGQASAWRSLALAGWTIFDFFADRGQNQKSACPSSRLASGITSIFSLISRKSMLSVFGNTWSAHSMAHRLYHQSEPHH